MPVIQKLAQIQSKLKAPKVEFNNFGKYNYRTCESILEAVKPLLKSTKTVILLDDEPVMVGERIYIKATATLRDTEDDSYISSTAYARESLDKKGMDQAQVTGAASSYARKYALGGLLAIDDNADPDVNNVQVKQNPKKATKKEIDDLIREAGQKGYTQEMLEKACFKDYKQRLSSIDVSAFAQLSSRIRNAPTSNA